MKTLFLRKKIKIWISRQWSIVVAKVVTDLCQSRQWSIVVAKVVSDLCQLRLCAKVTSTWFKDFLFCKTRPYTATAWVFWNLKLDNIGDRAHISPLWNFSFACSFNKKKLNFRTDATPYRIHRQLQGVRVVYWW